MMVMMEVPMLEAGKDRCKMPHVTACEPSCAIFSPGQCRTHGGSSAPQCGGLRRTKEKQEKALALSVRQGGYFCPQCGQLRGRELTLF